MSSQNAAPRLTLRKLQERAAQGEKLVMLTAYDASFARISDEAGVDILLIGDSLGMVIQGHDSTLPVTLEQTEYHVRCVARGAARALVVADMPFGSYQISEETAVANAIRLVKEAGADAVKLEGAGRTLTRISGIVEAGIPVMGHVGLTPQSATLLGGYRAQARTARAAARLIDEAVALERAGCFSIVLEAVPAVVAIQVTAAVGVPVIGIGAGAGCSGQVLVWHDVLGLSDGPAPRFVKAYADLKTIIGAALRQYADEVRSGAYPEPRHTYGMPEDEQERFASREPSRKG
jgi:3-methyl-2-oxobutanoate hydroxymethyltransferase